jgi:hypothetical protein
MAGTDNDAVLVVELAKLAAMSGVPEAARVIFADDFDPDAIEAIDPHVRTVLGFNETVATLVKNTLLDRDLVYDWLWVAGGSGSGPLRSAPARRRELRTCTRTSRPSRSARS